MKTKLYHKVLKMAVREYCNDDRPSKCEVEHALNHYLKQDAKKCINNFKFYLNGTSYTSKAEEMAWLGSLVWSWRHEDDSYRYSLKRIIEEKYKQHSRKYWAADKVLLRAIATGDVK